ncbi:MAG: acetylxylan esterase [Thermoguttaceae bacterium]|jgi:cephalosporin-C deacetylase-like acetyl esterase|nr:acetylxylan esterase [Thermoguttaceae bacterium]
MRHRVIFPLALWAVLASSVPASEPTLQLSVVTDRPEAIYAVGEQASFVVTLKQGDQPVPDAEVTCVLDKDGMPPVAQKTLKLSNGAATVEGTLPEPGFLRCRVVYGGRQEKPLAAMAAAAFDPLKIPPSLPAPEDFDSFWAQQKARLATVPMKPTLTPVKSPVEGVECFDAQIPCVPPRPVSGYFARPTGAGPKSCPAILLVHGAGVRSSNLGGAAGAARRFGALAMDINAHGIPNGKPDVFYKELSDGELCDYRTAGREDRQQCYFLGMFLRLVRAMEFLTSQPEWDGQVLIVRGSSQGGGQAIAAAGLDHRVTFIAAGVPAICDHSGKAIGRASGWPQLVPDRDGKPDPKVLQVARYFDGMNFAARSKAEAIMSVGFIDVTCPPTSVYAAYNNLPGKKQMVNEPLMGHAVSPKFERAADAAVAEHIARKRKP